MRLAAFVLFVVPAILVGCNGTTVVEPGTAATKLAFTTQPVNGNTGVALPAVVVVAQDVAGNTVAGYTSPITVSLGSNPSGDTLLGSLTLNAGAGVVSFTDLVIRRIGTGYALVASASGLTPAGSASFDVTGWQATTSMPTARSGLGVAIVNGIIYAMGGTSAAGTLLTTVEAYDPGAGTWTAKAPMPRARSHFALGAVNGKLYAVGGVLSDGITATVDAYDPVADSWAAKAGMPSAREDLGVAVVNGILFAAGGTATTQPLAGISAMEAYDPVADSWTVKAALTTPRRDLGVAAVGGLVYAVGGNPGTALGGVTVEVYDPTADAWTTKASLPFARAALGACGTGGLLYAVGGVSIGISSMVQSYDPTADAWTLKAPLLTPRQYLGVACTASMVYGIGGSLGAAGPTTANEVFQP